ncbi:MAG: winged helix-turn-helix domain-containing protein [Candidatus Thermoplasmatota archaeon]|nr:winged helix-turn-helix domain-containing protein [Candidatus Thermoplasmatota archaeon]MDP7265352.1 winged helix-turn-helix domain-containing protein [Candidatus Thermoplasmatota archaeon]
MNLSVERWLFASALFIYFGNTGNIRSGGKIHNIEAIRILENEKRRLIFTYIGEHPGEHYRRIKRELGIASGTLRHHLRRLEEAGMIRSERVGKYRYFYPICKNRV